MIIFFKLKYAVKLLKKLLLEYSYHNFLHEEKTVFLFIFDSLLGSQRKLISKAFD
jgi:hypothetical protein